MNQSPRQGGGGALGDDAVVDLEAPSAKVEEPESKSQAVCRICHLAGRESDESGAEELEEIGCGCRGELGIAHARCSEAWFRVKGNQTCEICGETAKNVGIQSENRGSAAAAAEVCEIRRASNVNNNSNNGRLNLIFKLVLTCVIIGFAFPWVYHANLI